MDPQELANPLTSEALVSFRTVHSIREPVVLSVSRTGISDVSGKGNFVIMPQEDSGSVYRIIRYTSEDMRSKIDAATFIALLQGVDPKTKTYFPVIKGFGKADIRERSRKVMATIVVRPHDSGAYDFEEAAPTVEVERISDSDGWSTNPGRQISHEDGLAALVFGDLGSINTSQLQLDVENTLRVLAHLLEAQLLLSQHNRVLRDIKQAFATHVNLAGKVDQVKILDMDNMYYIVDAGKRETTIRAVLAEHNLLLTDSVRNVLRQYPDIPNFQTPAFKMFLQLDLHFRQSQLSPDLQKKLGIQPTSLKQTQEMLSQMIRQLESGQGGLAGIDASEYIAGYAQLQQAERQITRERADGSVGIPKRFDAWQNFLVEAFNLNDAPVIQQIADAISLQNHGKAGELLLVVDNSALNQLGQLLVNFDGKNAASYYGACPTVSDDVEKLDPSKRLIQDLFIVVSGLGQEGNLQNVRQFIENLKGLGVTNIPQVLIDVLKSKSVSRRSKIK